MLDPELAGQAQHAIAWSLRICGVGVLIGSLELIYRQGDLLPDRGLLGWAGLSQAHTRLPNTRLTALLLKLMQPMLFRIILLIRAGAAAGLALSLLHPFTVLVMGILAGLTLTSTFVHHLRLPIGTDGSDHMNAIVLTTGTLALLINNPQVYVAGAIFIGSQLALSYVVAGAAKAFSTEWRSGRGTSNIFCTWTYGLPPFGEFLSKHVRLSRFIDWGVISFELLFPLGLFLPTNAARAVLILGFCFHVGNAAIMGLNSFFWAFTSGYPAILFAVSFVKKHL